MLTSEEIKEFVLSIGAEECGIASIDRFSEAPKGFNPADVYDKCRSVIVFLKQMPAEIILAPNVVPYTHTAYMLYSELDRIGLRLCEYLQKKSFNGIPIPSDTPYLFWDEETKHGQGIISLRHSARLAGLGFLGKNTLLINERLGNMAYIGAVLTDSVLKADPLFEDFNCPPKCRVCLDACSQNALDGLTVSQKLCRQFSFYKNERGFDIYACNECRKSCIYRTGKRKIQTKTQA